MTGEKPTSSRNPETPASTDVPRFLYALWGRAGTQEQFLDADSDGSLSMDFQLENAVDGSLQELHVILPGCVQYVPGSDAYEAAIIAHTHHPTERDEPNYRHFEAQFTPNGREMFEYFRTAITDPEDDPSSLRDEIFRQDKRPARPEDIQHLCHMVEQGRMGTGE